MLTRRSLILELVAGAASLVSPAIARAGLRSSQSAEQHRKDRDQDNDDVPDRDEHDADDREEARKAVTEGRAVPLRDILAIVLDRYPGQVLDVRIENTSAGLAYNIKILDSRGRVLVVSVDAASKAILKARGL